MKSFFIFLFSLLIATTGFAQAPDAGTEYVTKIQNQFKSFAAAQAISSGQSCRSSKDCGKGKNCLSTFTGGKCSANPCGAFYGKCVSGESCSAFGKCCGFTCH